MEIEDIYTRFLQYPSIQTDTRKIQQGDIFFALKGPNFNGNTFVRKALDSGAAYVVADEPQPFEDDRIINVRDVLTTLQQLAKYHRQQFDIPFIAITGSNGKTTTKELIHAVLSTTYQTYTTRGNLNNHIGIPLTILSVKKDAAIAVIEMGANHQKEIEGYCKYTMPTHGLITNCGKAHLEGFGGIEGVKKGKGELFDYLRENNGTAFIMKDYTYLREMSKGIHEINTYGTQDADVTGIAADTLDFLEIILTKGSSIKKIATHLVGVYNLPNVLAAVAVGSYFKVEDNKIKSALEQYAPSNSRSQMLEKDGNRIVLDAYNANPSSMKAAIENFASMEGDEKILLLGGMMELGNESLSEHKALVDLISTYHWKKVVLVGGDFNLFPHNYLFFNNSIQAKEWLQQQHLNNATLLIKGSRSMQMEKIIE